MQKPFNLVTKSHVFFIGQEELSVAGRSPADSCFGRSLVRGQRIADAANLYWHRAKGHHEERGSGWRSSPEED